MRTQTIFAIAALLVIFSCNPNQEKSPPSFAPKVVEAHGYLVPRDSMAEPKVIPAGKPKIVHAGRPKVILTNTNVHPAGIPKIVIAGVPKMCTPGQDSFSLPKTVLAIDSPFMAGIPEVVTAREADIKDQNPQNFSSFGKLQGLKSALIHCMIHDKNGNLWLGTAGGGVSRYDGKSFTNFTEKEGLADNWIHTILQDKSGNLWFGSYSGVSKYDGKNFTRFTRKEGLIDVTSSAEDQHGNLWFNTAVGGVSRYDGKSFTNFTEKEGLSNSVTSILVDKAGNVWFGTYKEGICRFDGKSFTHFTEKEGLSNNAVSTIQIDKRGHLLIGSRGGISIFDGKKFTHFTEKEGLIGNDVSNIVEDESGNHWIGYWEGRVSKFDGKSFTDFTEKEGLNNYPVWSILEDKGSLWFGTQMGGVSKYSGKRFTHFTDKEGLTNNVVRSILQDKSGNVWFGTDGGGVSRYNGKSFTNFTAKEGLVHNSVWSIYEDKSGNLWFGTLEGVSRYDGKSFTNFTVKEGMGSNDVYSIFEDKKGDFWFGATGGVTKYDGKSFTYFTEKQGLNTNLGVCFSIMQDKSGNLWFGTAGGVTEWDGKSFVRFTEKEGLSNNVVKTILEDKSGNFWFGTTAGVTKYDGKSFTHFTEEEGLSNNNLYGIIEDKNGDLWFGTAFGLNKLKKDKLTSGLSKPELFFKTYTYEDGFAGIGVNIGKTICEAKDGTIWIGANDRLTAFRPGEEAPDTTAPNIQLSGLTLFSENIAWQNLISASAGGGRNPDSYREKAKDTSIVLGNGVRFHDFHFDGVSKWYGVPEHLSLPYNNNYLTFKFVGITIQSPKKVKYQYKLEGLDENWSALTNRSEAPYGNLPHGKYTFKVRAINGDGYWSKEFNYSFTIRPPWWYTWWAYCLYGLLILAAVVATHRYQKQRIIQIEREKSQKKELAQAKEIEKAYNELQTTQAQLVQREKMASLGELTAGIAHEIQNPLNFVTNFSEVNTELIEELKEERKKEIRDFKNEDDLLNDIKENEEKINHHGKRADAIVKGMLQHSRSSSGVKEPTDINALADEYLRLAYHGLRAKDKNFNATIKTDYDEGIGKTNIIPQDIGRVLLNFYNNAFYAVAEKKKQQPDNYEPTISVSTKKINNKVEIRVKDNGNGIPQKVLDKIYQPFFTTKPTGQGTGLGLSLSYDIVKAHGGEIKVDTREGEFAEFVIQLPITA